MPAFHFAAQISPDWVNVRMIRARVNLALAAESAEIRVATCMVVAELLENAVKYGTALPDARGIDFVLQVKDGGIEVRVESGTPSQEHIQRLAARIQEVDNLDSSGLHYLKRLDEIMNDPEQSGGLGLYRIAVEGEFKLSIEHKGDVFAVIARRRTT